MVGVVLGVKSQEGEELPVVERALKVKTNNIKLILFFFSLFIIFFIHFFFFFFFFTIRFCFLKILCWNMLGLIDMMLLGI